MKDRIRNAVEFLKDSLPFQVENLGFALDKSGGLEVSGWSAYKQLKYLTKGICFQELEGIKEEFGEMVNISDELREFIKDREIIYYLNFDNYGKSSIIICSEKRGVIKWYIEIK
jgi:hypothetical protein